MISIAFSLLVSFVAFFIFLSLGLLYLSLSVVVSVRLRRLMVDMPFTIGAWNDGAHVVRAQTFHRNAPVVIDKVAPVIQGRVLATDISRQPLQSWASCDCIDVFRASCSSVGKGSTL